MNHSRSSTGRYRYHNRIGSRHTGKTERVFYHFSSGKTFEKQGNGFVLYGSPVNARNSFVEIEFYLPEPACTKLILMDSQKNEVIYLINEELEAGRHIYKSDIKKEELRKFQYYYKLDAYGYQEIREMRHI